MVDGHVQQAQELLFFREVIRLLRLLFDHLHAHVAQQRIDELRVVRRQVCLVDEGVHLVKTDAALLLGPLKGTLHEHRP